jgi:glyoxylase-like metal-dependent hydrolase (beta-lactamase superfamily II)
MTYPLSTDLDYIDLQFLGETGIIATGLLQGRDGIALIDPGPTTTIGNLKTALASKGTGLADVRAILLTHIHLDHAGATGTLLPECPGAKVYVHEIGARHLADPSKLLVSARRLYGDDMDRLWGEVRPVPADRIEIVGNTRLRVVGHDVEVAETPGHASHHVSFFLPDPSIAFVGDTAGICRASGRVVLPATPPPDVDLEAWHRSTSRILAWHPDVLFLTHFGPHRSPRVHFNDFWTRMNAWSLRAKALLERAGDDEARAGIFTDEVRETLTRATSRHEAQAYAYAARFDFSWQGLARYWRKTGVRHGSDMGQS